MRAPRRGLLLAATLGAVAGSGGCAAAWMRQGESRDIVRTNVVVDTDPPGAMVTFNAVKMDRAPVRIPVEYDHVAQRWARQNNYGSKIREDTGTIGTILLFPIWLPASIVQFREEMVRHVYGGNRHVVGAWADGHADASQEITLEGEDEIRVTLRLEPTTPAPARQGAPGAAPR